MIKLLYISGLFALVACGGQSSPEGRSVIRDEQIQSQINLLKEQNKAILDSIKLINNEIKAIKY
ncbi:hypothetical protein [Arcticibacter tournemirensis]|uniref:hypothetical protein n=1 Tax=Arcticibacter tournemirensis TaxID=699437 RepID=UPI001F327FF0|nr:hypothetical protein [Arcticibacter tournemirensis]